jgi:hypothetical protein
MQAENKLTFETVSAHPSNCHAVSRISFLLSKLLHYTQTSPIAQIDEAIRHTGIATYGGLRGVAQLVKTRHRLE